MAVINFDSSQVAPSTGTADALPAGWYNVMMDESDVKPTSKSTPDNPQYMLACRFNILDGQYQGRKVFVRLNIKNSNPQAVEIAYKDLSAICHAVGMIGVVQDSTMLHGKPLKIKVKLRAATGEYEASNEVSAYKNINEQVGGAPGAPGVNPGMPPAMGVVPPAQQAWAPPAQQQQPTGYPPGAYAGAGAPQGQPQYQPPGQPTYAPQQPPQQPQQAWAPPVGQQPWAGQPGQPQGQPQQQPVYQPPQQPQGQPQYAPQGQPQQPQQGAPVGNPNPMAGQPPPWQ